MAGARDSAIWEAAKSGGFVLVTKDEDFQGLSVFRGQPPKVVHVRLGNASTAATLAFFEEPVEIIVAFAADSEAGFLALG